MRFFIPIFCSFIAATIILPAAAENDRPNIILIMADDVGYECFGCNGSEMYETPNIDSLAASGMRFKNAHSQPICTPSRVQIMSGIYNNRNYVKFGYLDPEVKTFGNVMRDAGYQTCIAGKWQLEGGFEGPKKFGFDRYCLWQLSRRPSRYPNPGLEIDGVEKDFKDGKFGPDLVSNYINDYMTEMKDEGPFFVYYPMIMPHWPFVPTPDSKDWDPTMWNDKKSEPGGYKSQKYWDDMVRYTDKMVGKVVSKLDELKIRDNTLVMFTGDNGTYTEIVSRFEGKDYKGGKGSPKDNGTHVPFIASWPSKIEGGQVSEELVDFSDLFPTITEVSDTPTPEGLDGKSLAPVFTGEGSRDKDHIYCWYSRDGKREGASQHVRDARYKLYANGGFYDTWEDPLEKVSLTLAKPSPEALAAQQKLSPALAKHVAATKTADPIQNAKRNIVSPPKKKKDNNQKTEQNKNQKKP